MAHYALLDKNNIVTQVITGRDENELGIDWEQFYSNETGCLVKRTSYNTIAGTHTQNGDPFRKNYAGIGFSYDAQRDPFIPPKPFDSWLLNEESCQWEPPVPLPTDGKNYTWDEATTSWIEVANA